MNVLVACEFSGIVSKAFRDRGHDVWSCDLINTDGDKSHHVIADVRKITFLPWDMVIAFPPCTYLCNSGVSWLEREPGRKAKMVEASEFFKHFLNLPVEKIVVENPIPHKYGQLPKYNQIVHPYMFGHKERKATCLWLKGVPKLVETNNVYEEMLKLPKKLSQRLHWASPSENRWKIRSTTFQGLANAMAEQWG